jgi:hypothetical protein
MSEPNGFEAAFDRAIDNKEEDFERRRPTKQVPAPQVKLARDAIQRMKKDIREWTNT